MMQSIRKKWKGLWYRKNGQATFEYLALLTIILFLFFTFQKYLIRGISGRWKITGDSFGKGMLFDLDNSVSCASDTRVPELWYDVKCFYENNCDLACFTTYATSDTCRSCILSSACDTDICNN